MKAMLPSKQIKLSHLISMYGHLHLMEQTIVSINMFEINLANNKSKVQNNFNFDFDDMKMYIDDSYSSPMMSPRDLNSPAMMSE